MFRKFIVKGICKKKLIKNVIVFIFAILAISMGSLAASESELLRQIESHLLLEDAFSALSVAKQAKQFYPDSKRIQRAYVKTLARAGKETEALSELKKQTFEEWQKDPECLKEMGWAILKKGFYASQYSLKLTALIALAITQEAKAIPFILETLESHNNILKQLSFQLVTYFPDQVIKEKLSQLLGTEQNWALKMQLIEAIGRLKITEKAVDLKAILGSEGATFEEKGVAIKALIQMYDRIDLCQLRLLLYSPISGLRQLGLELAAYFQVIEVKDKIVELLKDDSFQVRFSALQALALYYKDFLPEKQLKTVLIPLVKDFHPQVAVEAALVLLFVDQKAGEEAFLKLLFSSDLEVARLASGRIQKAGKRGVSLALKGLKGSKDNFVKANLALALISQRTELKRCFAIFDQFFSQKRELWMWQDGALAVSQVRHVLHLPNYPKHTDQKVQLDLLLLLASLEDQKALSRLRSFLMQKSHGLTSFAAWALLQEGGLQESSLIYKLLEDKDASIRVEAALILAIYHKDKSVLPILEKAYFEANHELKLEILGALGFIGAKTSLPFLLKALDESLPILRIATAAALIQVAKA